MAVLTHTTELAMYIELALTPRINGLNIVVRQYRGLNLYLLTDRRGGIRCTARTWIAAVRGLAQCLAIDAGTGWKGLQGYRKGLAALADIGALEAHAKAAGINA